MLQHDHDFISNNASLISCSLHYLAVLYRLQVRDDCVQVDLSTCISWYINCVMLAVSLMFPDSVNLWNTSAVSSLWRLSGPTWAKHISINSPTFPENAAQTLRSQIPPRWRSAPSLAARSWSLTWDLLVVWTSEMRSTSTHQWIYSGVH